MNNKKFKYLIIILAALIISLFFRLNPDYLTSADLKRRMYSDFKSYEKEIESLNRKLLSIIIADNYDVNKLLLNDEVIKNFLKSKNDASRIKNKSSGFDYDDVYRKYNEIIQNILDDGIINDTEKVYISTLYDYNKEIIKNFNTEDKSYKNIIKSYVDFSSSADEILNTQRYEILKEYRDDFSDFDLKRSEAFIKDVFSKVVPGRKLNYNNMDDIYADSVIFTTLKDGNAIESGKIYEEIPYQIEYNKNSREVHLRALGRIVPSYTFSEEEIDVIVRDIITRLDYKGVLDEKSVSNIDVPQMSSIKYSYIYKADDVHDKQQDLNIELDSYGLVNSLYIIDSDDYKNTEFTDISETIRHIEENSEINSIHKIRNISGELEYIIYINYKGTNYSMVMDGITGKYKYTN